MKNSIIHLLLVVLFVSCGKPSGKKEHAIKTDTLKVVSKTKAIEKEQVVVEELKSEKDTISIDKVNATSISIKATILSVKEALIMPSDYLTTAMTVKTVENDTLVFLDMGGFEKLVNQDISIKYKLKIGEKLLVCFDCTTFSEKVMTHDITSFLSEVKFKKLRFKKYIQDEYIDIASTYVMSKEDGEVSKFLSNNNELVSDSIKMASSFFNYGVVTTFYPELENRQELEELLK